MSDEVMTVLGGMSAADLGVTSMHEHLLVDGSFYADLVDPAYMAPMAHYRDDVVTIDKLAILRKNILALQDNMRQTDEELIAGELAEYKEVGGRTILDVTAVGIRVNIAGVQRLAERSGVNIITSTGFYIEPGWPEKYRAYTVDQFMDHMLQELNVGIEETGIRAGHIKVGVTDLSEAQERVLVAAARAAIVSGASVTAHPGYEVGNDGRTICDILMGEGLAADRIIIAHTEAHLIPRALSEVVFMPDLPLVDLSFHRDLLRRGVNVSFDTFGSVWDAEPAAVMQFPDWMRFRAIVTLLMEGYGGQIVLGNDVFMKTMTRPYGGSGYRHLLDYVVPTLRGLTVSDYEIRRMTVKNPARLLTKVSGLF